MLLRISLIVAILTGLGVIGVSQFVLKPQIEGIAKQRDDNKDGWEKTKGELGKTRTTLKQTSEKLAKTESTLEETKGQLTATTAKFDNEQKRANGLQDNLTKANAELKTTKDELFVYTVIGVKPEEIKQLVTNVKTLTAQNEGLREEVKLFTKKAADLKVQLDQVLGKDNQDPVMAREIRGKVLVVDPKWDFLVLDVGSRTGVPQNGVMLISRNGELVAKVRVMNVQDQRSIANIMPGWKIKDVLEGDVVLPY